MSFSDDILKDQSDEEALRLDWSGDYDNAESGCVKCRRMRLMLCNNGKHRCEKCNWCPEEKRYVGELGPYY